MFGIAVELGTALIGGSAVIDGFAMGFAGGGTAVGFEPAGNPASDSRAGSGADDAAPPSFRGR